MKLTFLGTGTSQGVPVIGCSCDACLSNDFRDNRLRSSVLVESPLTSIAIDAGPDFRQQMLRVKQRKLDAILLTHEHRDHVAGLDDVRAFNFFSGKPMDVWAELRVQQAISKEYEYAFSDEKYPGSPDISLHTIDGNNFNISDIDIIPIRALHYKMPVFGFRIEGLTYITDANYISDEEKKKINGSEVLIVNALRRKKHLSHFTLYEAINLIEEIRPRKAYLTHISHQMGISAEIEKELPDNVFLAYDGLEIFF